MRTVSIALAVAAGLLAAAPATAVTFNFSFTNAIYGTGLVQGTVSNLANNATGPGDVRILSSAAGYGVGSYNGNQFNSFTVANGEMISVLYESFGQQSNDPATACCSLALTSGQGAGLSNMPGEVAHGSAAPVTFTLASTEPGPAPIPLPAPLALLVAGLALLAGVSRLRPARVG